MGIAVYVLVMIAWRYRRGVTIAMAGDTHDFEYRKILLQHYLPFPDSMRRSTQQLYSITSSASERKK